MLMSYYYIVGELRLWQYGIRGEDAKNVAMGAFTAIFIKVMPSMEYVQAMLLKQKILESL